VSIPDAERDRAGSGITMKCARSIDCGPVHRREWFSATLAPNCPRSLAPAGAPPDDLMGFGDFSGRKNRRRRQVNTYCCYMVLPVETAPRLGTLPDVCWLVSAH
jgi:hypothetical protein